MPQIEQEGTVYSVVSFHLDQRIYALPLELVAQIIPMVKLTPLPQAHPAIAGVMNFRGEAVPVIDLRLYLGLPARAYELHTPILLSHSDSIGSVQLEGGRLIGLVVDEVHDVMDVPGCQITRVSDILPQGLGELPTLQGLVHTQDGVMMILDLDYLFSADPLKTLPDNWREGNVTELFESNDGGDCEPELVGSRDGDGSEPVELNDSIPQTPVTDKGEG